MSEQTDDQWKAALKAVFKKAAADADFRALCLSDPAAAIEEAAGVAFPISPSFRFVEKRELQVELPAFGQEIDAISDEELSSISGGTSGGMGTAARFLRTDQQSTALCS